MSIPREQLPYATKLMLGHVQALDGMYRVMAPGKARDLIKGRLEEAKRHLKEMSDA